MTLKQKLETLPDDMYCNVQTNRSGEFFGGSAAEILLERCDEILNGEVLRCDVFHEDNVFVYNSDICDMFVKVD